MGFLDKLLGRGKKAAGDVTGDSSMRSEGMHQEQQASANARRSTSPSVSNGPRRSMLWHGEH